MKKRIVSFCFAAFLCLCTLAVPVFASEPIGGGVATNGNSSLNNPKTNYYGDVATPNDILGQNGDTVTVDDATNWVDRKGGEVISMFVHAVKPICVIGIFLGIILSVFGAIGNKKLLVGGLIAVLICAVLFTVVTCWPQVLNAFSSWLMS